MASTKPWRRCFTVHERMAQKNAPVTVTKFHRGKVRELSFPDPTAPSIAREIAFASLLFAIRGNFSARIAPSLSLQLHKPS